MPRGRALGYELQRETILAKAAAIEVVEDENDDDDDGDCDEDFDADEFASAALDAP